MLKRVYNKRYKEIVCICGGGTPLGLTYNNVIQVLSILTMNLSEFSIVTLGMGDALVPALSLAMGATHVGGVELDSFSYHNTAQIHAENMIIESDHIPAIVMPNLHWGTDILNIPNITSILPSDDIKTNILAYGFDDSIPEKARRHWYHILEIQPRVKRIATCYNKRLDMNKILSNFAEISRFKVRIESSKCTRTMIILQRN